jgi:prephenate dehydrogenase
MVKITIIGLGQVGASIGLALKSQTHQVQRVGHDPDPLLAREAVKLGALDKASVNLPSSVDNADLIILALPAAETHKTIEIIAQDLKEEVVVLNFSPNQVAATSWAAQHIKSGRYFLSLYPAIQPDYLIDPTSGIEAARADLFQDSLVAVTCPPNTSSDAIKLASDFVVLLGARPYYADPVEVDGLLAASCFLPQLSAAALINAVVGQPGWRENQKLANRAFAEASAPVRFIDSDDNPALPFHLDRENMLRMLDDYLASLHDLRSQLAGDDSEALSETLLQADSARKEWLVARKIGEWNSAPTTEMPSSGEFMKGMFLGFRRKKK